MNIAGILSVAAASTLKFIFGPLGGLAIGLHFVEMYIATVGGMMASVVVFTYLGRFIKQSVYLWFFKQKPRLFTPSNRRKVRIWRQYGMAGVAFLTPLILTPIGGTLVATAFGEHRAKILLYMLISAAAWGLVLGGGIYWLGDTARQLLGH